MSAPQPATGHRILEAIQDAIGRLIGVDQLLARQTAALEASERHLKELTTGLVSLAETYSKVAELRTKDSQLLHELATAHRERMRRDDIIKERIDKFVLDPAFNLDGTVKSVIEQYDRMITALRQEHRRTRSEIKDLHLALVPKQVEEHDQAA